MVQEMINGTFRQTNLPNESEEYLSNQEELRRAEIELRHQRERVAELRRQLPEGPAVPIHCGHRTQRTWRRLPAAWPYEWRRCWRSEMASRRGRNRQWPTSTGLPSREGLRLVPIPDRK